MNIGEKIKEIKEGLPEGVKLVAVSKYHSVAEIKEAYDAGQRVFGESREQELAQKHLALPEDIMWHFIGHLQTNKVKQIVPYVDMIEAVDSFKLLVEINKQALRVGRVIPCLLEIHIAQEETKSGFTFDTCREMLTGGGWKILRNVSIAGVMGMATYTDDESKIRQEFSSLKSFFEEMKSKVFSGYSSFCEVSMGMSHDYPVALEEGSTMIRLGSKIFGTRK